MPQYDVQLNVNVPGLGNRNVVQSVTAADIKTAIDVAVAAIVITPLQVQKTG